MSDPVIASARIRAGRWEAEIASDAETAPRIEVWHLESQLGGVAVGARRGDGTWPVSVPIPADLLGDGVQTFLVRDAATGDRIGALPGVSQTHTYPVMETVVDNAGISPALF